MKVYCDRCAKEIGSVSSEKIPTDKTVYIKCPVCRTRIPLKRESGELAPMMEEESIETNPEPQTFPRNTADPGTPKKISQAVNQENSADTECPRGSMALSGSGLTKIAVGLFIVLFLFIGLRFWSHAKVYRLYELGPSRISQNNTSIAIYAGNRIYHLEKSGQIIKKVELEQLGIDAPVADIELLEDNSILIGERSNGKISRCNLSDIACFDVSPTGAFAIKDAFRFLANEKAGVVYISDTLNHRLLIHQLDGSYTGVTDTDVSYPNALAVDGDTLFLCDTFNSRVLQYEMAKSGDLERITVPFIRIASLTSLGGLKSMAAMNQQEFKAHLEKIKSDEGKAVMIDRPIALARDNSGKWWVGVSSEADMFGSEVQLYGPEGDHLSKLPYPAHSLAEDLTLLNGEIIITDPNLMMVYAVNPATYNVTDFGGEELREDLESLQTQNAIAIFFKKWSTRFMFLVGVCLLGLLFYLKSQDG